MNPGVLEVPEVNLAIKGLIAWSAVSKRSTKGQYQQFGINGESKVESADSLKNELERGPQPGPDNKPKLTRDRHQIRHKPRRKSLCSLMKAR